MTLRLGERPLIYASREQWTAWIEWLSSLGVHAAHPDDGWVDRELNRLHLAYPYFTDTQLDIGSLIALGDPTRPCRLVRVIGVGRNRFAPWYDDPWYWRFEPVATNVRQREGAVA